MPMQRDFNNASPNITVDKAALRERLTPVEYQVTQEKSTERYGHQYSDSQITVFENYQKKSHIQPKELIYLLNTKNYLDLRFEM